MPEKIDAVVANIPYQISSPLIEKLTQFLRNSRFSGPRICVLMVQEEFAMRFVMPGGQIILRLVCAQNGLEF